MKKVICPNCGAHIDHFENIGVEENRVCPECKVSITDEQLATLEEVQVDETE